MPVNYEKLCHKLLLKEFKKSLNKQKKELKSVNKESLPLLFEGYFTSFIDYYSHYVLAEDDLYEKLCEKYNLISNEDINPDEFRDAQHELIDILTGNAERLLEEK